MYNKKFHYSVIPDAARPVPGLDRVSPARPGPSTFAYRAAARPGPSNLTHPIFIWSAAARLGPSRCQHYLPNRPDPPKFQMSRPGPPLPTTWAASIWAGPLFFRANLWIR